MADQASQDVAELTFEAALKRLEEIVRKLESGEASLDEAIELYGEGDRLKQQCEARLKAAQARIEKIQLGRDGAPVRHRPFRRRTERMPMAALLARARPRSPRASTAPSTRSCRSPTDARARLYEAMRYAAIGGGKRMRPLLVIAACDLFNVDRRPGAARRARGRVHPCLLADPRRSAEHGR